VGEQKYGAPTAFLVLSIGGTDTQYNTQASGQLPFPNPLDQFFQDRFQKHPTYRLPLAEGAIGGGQVFCPVLTPRF
jgi:hypothetical protein